MTTNFHVNYGTLCVAATSNRGSFLMPRN